MTSPSSSEEMESFTQYEYNNALKDAIAVVEKHEHTTENRSARMLANDIRKELERMFKRSWVNESQAV